MNVCVISGQLNDNAIIRGKKTKALVFVVVTRQAGSNGQEGDSEGMTSFVPCVIFNPPADLEQLLTIEGKGKEIELQGRINSSRLDSGSEPRSNAEVVVYTKSVRIIR